MPSTVLDSDIFKDMFGTAEMRAVFSDENQLKCYVEAEVALAVAQGRLGVIPREAAEAIARLASSVSIDRDVLKHEAENVGYPILGLVRQLSGKLGEAGRYLHWGTTTQDIVDTATVLQIRAGLQIIERDMTAVSAALARLAEKYRDTPMPGRTEGSSSPARRRHSPAKNLNMWPARVTSPTASGLVLPSSRASSVPNSSRRARISLPILSSASLRA